MAIKIFEVGGCVRDEILGVASNDVDLLLVGAPTFEVGIRFASQKMGLNPISGTFKPEFLTFKASVPKNHDLRKRCKTIDFVMARKDGFHSDGRRPDSTSPGTLLDDLERRDFTINALAKDFSTGEIIDLFGGKEDLENGVLKFVGDPMERVMEDGLRVLRGLRFQVTKDLVASEETAKVLSSKVAVNMLSRVKRERVREEMEKMLRHCPIRSMKLLSSVSPELVMAIFSDGLRLSATLRS